MFEETLIKIANFLNHLSIPYMIIGGQAVLLYGEPRLTRDIDITLGIDIEKWLKEFDSALGGKNFLLEFKKLIENQ
jgi:hypothetical protein